LEIGEVTLLTNNLREGARETEPCRRDLSRPERSNGQMGVGKKEDVTLGVETSSVVLGG